MPEPVFDSNPYAAPRAKVADVYEERGDTQPVRLFSARGRMGRLRYLCWSTLLGLAGLLLCVIVVVTIGAGIKIFAVHSSTELEHASGSMLGAALGPTVIILIGCFVAEMPMMIQRSHDMGWSGSSILIMIVVVFMGEILARSLAFASPFIGGVIGFVFELIPYIWWIRPGTSGSNRFGPPPTSTPLAVQIFGWAVVAFIVLGLVGRALLFIATFSPYFRN